MPHNWEPADAPRSVGLQIIDEHYHEINQYGIEVLFDYQAGGVRGGGKERACWPTVKKGWNAYERAGRPSSLSENPKPVLPYFVIFIDQKVWEVSTPERRLYEMHMALARCSAEKDEESGIVVCKVLPFAYEGNPDIMKLYGPQTTDDKRFVRVAHGQMAMALGADESVEDHQVSEDQMERAGEIINRAVKESGKRGRPAKPREPDMAGVVAN